MITSNAFIDSLCNTPEEGCLDQDGDCGQKNADSKESSTLFNEQVNTRKKQLDNRLYLVVRYYQLPNARRDIVKENVCPTSKSVCWRQFPGL